MRVQFVDSNGKYTLTIKAESIEEHYVLEALCGASLSGECTVECPHNNTCMQKVLNAIINKMYPMIYDACHGSRPCLISVTARAKDYRKP